MTSTHTVRQPATAPLPPTLRLALFGALAATFDLLHDGLDQWAQTDFQAACKGGHGPQPAEATARCRTGGEGRRAGESATARGRRAATNHVVVYTVGQVAGTIAVTRVLGLRPPWRAVAAGALLNASTHWIIDRRRPLIAAARLAGKSDYLSTATVVRAPGGPAATTGPGTAIFELDRSAHRVIGLGAALLTTWLATRARGRR